MTLIISSTSDGPVFESPTLRVDNNLILQRGPGPASKPLIAGKLLQPNFAYTTKPRCFTHEGHRLFRTPVMPIKSRRWDPGTCAFDIKVSHEYIAKWHYRPPVRLPYFPRTMLLKPIFVPQDDKKNDSFICLRFCLSIDSEILPFKPQHLPTAKLHHYQHSSQSLSCRLIERWLEPLFGTCNTLYSHSELLYLELNKAYDGAKIAQAISFEGLYQTYLKKKNFGPEKVKLACDKYSILSRIFLSKVNVFQIASEIRKTCDQPKNLANLSNYNKSLRYFNVAIGAITNTFRYSDNFHHSAEDILHYVITAPPSTLSDAKYLGRADFDSETSLIKIRTRENLPPKSALQISLTYFRNIQDDGDSKEYLSNLSGSLSKNLFSYSNVSHNKFDFREPFFAAVLKFNNEKPRKKLIVSAKNYKFPVSFIKGEISARFFYRFSSSAMRLLRTIRLSKRALHLNPLSFNRRLKFSLTLPEPKSLKRCRNRDSGIISHTWYAERSASSNKKIGKFDRSIGAVFGSWSCHSHQLSAVFYNRVAWPEKPSRSTSGFTTPFFKFTFLPLYVQDRTQGCSYCEQKIHFDNRIASSYSIWIGLFKAQFGHSLTFFPIQSGIFKDVIEIILPSAPFYMLSMKENFNEILARPLERRLRLKHIRYIHDPGFMLSKRLQPLRSYYLSFTIQESKFLVPVFVRRLKMSVKRQNLPSRFPLNRCLDSISIWQSYGLVNSQLQANNQLKLKQKLNWNETPFVFKLLDQKCQQKQEKDSISEQETKHHRYSDFQTVLQFSTERVTEPPFIAPPPWEREHRSLKSKLRNTLDLFDTSTFRAHPERIWLIYTVFKMKIINRDALIDWPAPYYFSRYLRIRGAMNLRAPRKFIGPELHVGKHFPFAHYFHFIDEVLGKRPMPPRSELAYDLAIGLLPPIRQWREPRVWVTKSNIRRKIADYTSLKPGTFPYHHSLAQRPKHKLISPQTKLSTTEGYKSINDFLKHPLAFSHLSTHRRPEKLNKHTVNEYETNDHRWNNLSYRLDINMRVMTYWDLPPENAPIALTDQFKHFTASCKRLNKIIEEAVFQTNWKNIFAYFCANIRVPHLSHLPWLQFDATRKPGFGIDRQKIEMTQIRYIHEKPISSTDYDSLKKLQTAWGTTYYCYWQKDTQLTPEVQVFYDKNNLNLNLHLSIVIDHLQSDDTKKLEIERANLPICSLMPQNVYLLKCPDVSVYRRTLLRIARKFVINSNIIVQKKAEFCSPSYLMYEMKIPVIMYTSAPHWTILYSLMANLQILHDEVNDISINKLNWNRLLKIYITLPRNLTTVPSKRHLASRIPVIFRIKRKSFSLILNRFGFPPLTLKMSYLNVRKPDQPLSISIATLPSPHFLQSRYAFTLFFAPAVRLRPTQGEIFSKSLRIIPHTGEIIKRPISSSPTHFILRKWPGVSQSFRLPSFPDWLDLSGHLSRDAPRSIFSLRF